MALTSQTLVLLNVCAFQPNHLSLISTMDKTVHRVNAFTSLWVTPMSQRQKRVSQPLARTVILEPYSLSPSHSVSSEEFLNTFTAIVDLSQFNNSCLKSPASTLVDLTFQSRAFRSFSLNQLGNLSL